MTLLLMEVMRRNLSLHTSNILNQKSKVKTDNLKPTRKGWKILKRRSERLKRVWQRIQLLESIILTSSARNTSISKINVAFLNLTLLTWTIAMFVNTPYTESERRKSKRLKKRSANISIKEKLNILRREKNNSKSRN